MKKIKSKHASVACTSSSSLESQTSNLFSLSTISDARRSEIHSPFSRVPMELLSEIYLFYCAAQEPVYHEYQKNKSQPLASYAPSVTNAQHRFKTDADTIPPQLILTQVSYRWREVAHVTRGLWSSLTIYVKSGKFAHHVELASVWLERSGQFLPFDLHICIPNDEVVPSTSTGLMQLIISCAHRLRSLTVRAPLHTLMPLLELHKPDAPSLEHVWLDVILITEEGINAYMASRMAAGGTFTVFSSAPRLTSFCCSAKYPRVYDLEIEFGFEDIVPFGQIKDLSMDKDLYLDPARGLQLMRRSWENLETLCVRMMYPVSEASPVQNLTLPRLHSLQVLLGFRNQGYAFILDQLTLPSLKTLIINVHQWSTNVVVYELTDLARRSFFPLEVFRITNYRTPCDAHIVDFLLLVPSLRALIIHAEEDNLHTLIHMLNPRSMAYERRGSPVFLPNLTVLHLLTGPKSPAVFPTIGQVAKARFLPKTQAQKNGLASCGGEPLQSTGNRGATRGLITISNKTSTWKCRPLEILRLQLPKKGYDDVWGVDRESLAFCKSHGLDISWAVWHGNSTKIVDLHPVETDR